LSGATSFWANQFPVFLPKRALRFDPCFGLALGYSARGAQLAQEERSRLKVDASFRV
jgi:hypothetical protein